jgi:putative phosphoesterase
MRIAAIYDIHGNLPALEAVLEDIERVDVDLIVVGGDVAWGPFPSETIDVLLGLDAVEFIRGNADREVAERMGVHDGLAPEFAEVTEWCADQLTDDQRSWLRDLPSEFVVDVEGSGTVLFCHGSPRSDEEIITPLSPEERLIEALAGVTANTIVCGHTHMQFTRTILEKRIANAGSVGLPYQRPAGAYWLLVGSELEHRRTDYDTEGAAEIMRRTDCPHLNDIFTSTIVSPPDSTEIARLFESRLDQEA